jgi:type IX secretion system substrate protein
MKKIICLIGLIGMMQSGFAKMHTWSHYNNYTQNTVVSGYDIQNMNVSANIGDSIVFQAYILCANCMSMYYYPGLWYLEGDSIPNSGGEFLTVTINQYGTYSAPIQVDNWLHMLYFIVNNTTGIPSIKNINFFDVFPTAVTSAITIQLNSIKTNNIEISFFDMNGKQLKTDFYKNISGEFIKNENTEALLNGMYFVRIKAGDEVMQKKFVKM